ncbi:proline-rich receptor-like protein kinase PERK9 [Iris pallida]|uniref:Proline-rich receptor-like protein kinase PERK9 n=1 Tax=Iris pallida TaxID=29817 RepID=A0AAX6F6G7_IRIPA|nr:proline-rich receptor-like protein kinase PERK9 [Iris pallida]
MEASARFESLGQQRSERRRNGGGGDLGPGSTRLDLSTATAGRGKGVHSLSLSPPSPPFVGGRDIDGDVSDWWCWVCSGCSEAVFGGDGDLTMVDLGKIWVFWWSRRSYWVGPDLTDGGGSSHGRSDGMV